MERFTKEVEPHGQVVGEDHGLLSGVMRLFIVFQPLCRWAWLWARSHVCAAASLPTAAEAWRAKG
ncbi:hypothetical protein NKDENANG_01124 [Candidatus Entotheonellaceae bacterium PAL068K]